MCLSSRFTPRAKALSLSFFFTLDTSRSCRLFDGRTRAHATRKPHSSSTAKIQLASMRCLNIFTLSRQIAMSNGVLAGTVSPLCVSLDDCTSGSAPCINSRRTTDGAHARTATCSALQPSGVCRFASAFPAVRNNSEEKQ